MNLTIINGCIMCMYIFFSILRNDFSFLLDAPHIINLNFRKLKTLLMCPQEMRLTKTSVFLHYFSKFMGIFYVYFLASENDKMGFPDQQKSWPVPLRVSRIFYTTKNCSLSDWTTFIDISKWWKMGHVGVMVP